jgi:hypothetical protein
MKRFISKLMGITMLLGSGSLAFSSSAQEEGDFSLLESCKDIAATPIEQHHSQCFQYIQGFLDGALLTDSTIMQGLKKQPKMSDYSERVFRTRVGKTRDAIPDTYLADFCLPDSKVTDEVVLKVIDGFNKIATKSEPMADQIYSSVKASFPCPREYYN